MDILAVLDISALASTRMPASYQKPRPIILLLAYLVPQRCSNDSEVLCFSMPLALCVCFLRYWSMQEAQCVLCVCLQKPGVGGSVPSVCLMGNMHLLSVLLVTLYSVDPSCLMKAKVTSGPIIFGCCSSVTIEAGAILYLPYSKPVLATAYQWHANASTRRATCQACSGKATLVRPFPVTLPHPWGTDTACDPWICSWWLCAIVVT